MTIKDLAVIIVSYNTREFLGPCLDALPAALSQLAAEVWVVDNASPDGSADLVRDGFGSVRLIESLATAATPTPITLA